MDRSRRSFIAASAAVGVGPLITIANAAEPAFRDGRKAISKEEMLAMDARLGRGELTCVRTAESGDGPFYYESSPLRRNLVEGRKGFPLRLGITVANATVPGSSCAPLAGAVVDVWHADGDGMYSNVSTDLQNEDTRGKTFMRGHQITGPDGRVEFDTVVPGWELVISANPQGVVLRATHIHVKVFHEHKIVTTQLYFPDAFLDELYASIDPYTKHRRMTAPGLGRDYERIRNDADIVFQGDQSSPMKVQRVGNAVHCDAMIGVVTLGSVGVAPTFR